MLLNPLNTIWMSEDCTELRAGSQERIFIDKNISHNENEHLLHVCPEDKNFYLVY